MSGTPTCPYCSKPAALVNGAVIYPHRRDLASKSFWFCAQDQAWVGCHPGTNTALGRLANSELREAKRAAHDAFDPLWTDTGGSRNKRGRARESAYDRLAHALGIPRAQCHIGMFDADLCRRTVEVCKTMADAQ